MLKPPIPKAFLTHERNSGYSSLPMTAPSTKKKRWLAATLAMMLLMATVAILNPVLAGGIDNSGFPGCIELLVAAWALMWGFFAAWGLFIKPGPTVRRATDESWVTVVVFGMGTFVLWVLLWYVVWILLALLR
ncbi:MAG: hypothetical protein LW822_03285 [Phycisphaeraceae bacterium]|nr:hypothetical protein [Phycisphaeraceae bacterium]